MRYRLVWLFLLVLLIPSATFAESKNTERFIITDERGDCDHIILNEQDACLRPATKPYIPAATRPIYGGDKAGDGCNYNIRDSLGRIIGATTRACGEFISEAEYLKKWAEPFSVALPKDCTIGQLAEFKGQYYLCSQHNEWEVVERRDVQDVPVCLAHMEAAMRAMHVFIPHQLVAVTSAHDSWWEPSRRIDELEMPAYTAAMRLWATVKRECWSQP